MSDEPSIESWESEVLELVGRLPPSVSRERAAVILDISYSTLKRRIQSGDIRPLADKTIPKEQIRKALLSKYRRDEG